MYIVVLTTFASREEGERIGEILLKERLAACIQLKEVESLYMWRGELQKDMEIQGIIKTRKELYDRVEECIVKNHSYDLPQVAVLDISEGSRAYLQWIEDETLS